MRSVLFLLSVVTLPALQAQYFFGGGVSARTSAQAEIYSPSADNVVDALAVNPAGLAAVSGPTLNLTVSGMRAGGSFTNAANLNSPMRQNLGLAPFGAFGMPLGRSRWSIGFAVTPDVLSSAKWSYHDTPGGAGVTYGAQRETSRTEALRSSAGVSFALTPKIWLGATIGAVYNSNTLEAPYVFQSQPVLKGLKTLLNLNTTGVGLMTTWGAVVKIRRNLALGAAYRTSSGITSIGSATGNASALFAALGVNADSTFAYRAQVKVVLPQAALSSAAWQLNPRLRLSVQADWAGWQSSFQQLPVRLTQGSNPVVNSLLNSTSLNDVVPLDWKQQFTVRAALERKLGENFSISGGFLHTNNPVPASTLSPLTAAIMQNGVSAGFGYVHGRYRLDAAYSMSLPSAGQVGASALASEYSNSQVRIGTQALRLSTSFHL